MVVLCSLGWVLCMLIRVWMVIGIMIVFISIISLSSLLMLKNSMNSGI